MSKDNNLIVDSFVIDPKIRWRMDESNTDSVVDGVNILGRAVGPFFVPDGHSLNKRFYSKSLWETAIKNNGERLEFGEMLGTIGHDQPLDDQALLEGKVSHKVTKLWIDEETGAGMGEIQILATSAGKELNALLRGGVRLKVSSRAMGEYKGKTKDGSQIIDEESFRLEGFDFVQRPGVPTAIPVLVESDQSDDANREKNSSTENTMSQEILESIAKEKVKLEAQLSEALGKVSILENDKGALRSALESKDKEIARVEENLGERNRKVTVLESQIADLQSQVSAYAELGTSSEVETAMDNATATISAYKEFGTPSELTTAFERVNQLVEDYSEMGSPDEIEAALDLVEDYTALGTVEEVTAKLELLAKFEGLGSFDDLSRVMTVAESYAELGSPVEISQAFEMTESIVNKYQDEARTKEVAEISAKFSVKTDVVESMIKKHGKDETVSILESIKSVDVADRFVAPTPAKISESAPSKEIPAEVLEESAKPDNVAGARISRLMESFSR